VLAITPIAVNGGTATHDAVRRLQSSVLVANNGWRSNSVPTLVLFITDGGPRDPVRTATQISYLNTAFGSSI
jgi:hypothetical protein